jgi:hypothetical protein
VTRFLILVSTVFVSALTTPAIAGYFPSRPPGVPVQYFTGVIRDYGLGNGTGGFTLTIGATTMDFFIGLPMKINGTIVRCQSPRSCRSGVRPLYGLALRNCGGHVRRHRHVLV